MTFPTIPIETDDRISCRICKLFTPQSLCEMTKRLTHADLPRRCIHYRPGPRDPDKRNGRSRWPSLEEHEPK